MNQMIPQAEEPVLIEDTGLTDSEYQLHWVEGELRRPSLSSSTLQSLLREIEKVMQYLEIRRDAPAATLLECCKDLRTEILRKIQAPSAPTVERTQKGMRQGIKEKVWNFLAGK